MVHGEVKPDYYIASFSGGKDSTAMLLHLLELDMPVDEILFCDTGLEFPEMYEHIDKVEKYIDREITRVKPEHDFEFFAFEYMPPKRDKEKYGDTKGFGWATPMNRWCTYWLKTVPRRKHLKPLKEKYNILHYVGIAADEGYRLKRKSNTAADQLHPLVDWGWAEKDCLEYCKNKGFTWGGLYDLFPRVSCWCCPMQSLKELRILRVQFPDLWTQLKSWDKRAYSTFRMGHVSVEDLENRFIKEELAEEIQGKLF